MILWELSPLVYYEHMLNILAQSNVAIQSYWHSNAGTEFGH